MKKVGLLAVAALMLFASSGGRAFAQASNPVNSNTITITLNEQNASGQSGTATLTDDNGKLMVTLNISNGTSTPQPAHIHKGTCANLDPNPLIPLTSVVNGASITNIDLTANASVKSLNDLMSGQYAINIHKSGAEAKVYVACGDIVNMQMGGGAQAGATATPGTTGTTGGPAGTSTSITIPLNEQNGSGQSGSATLTDNNGQLTVVLNLSNGSSVAQPAHIHKGSCANLDPNPLIPLTSVVNGASTTNIDLTANASVKSLSDLMSGQYAINVHKSAAEAKVYVACGDIMAMEMGGTGTTGTTGTTGGGTTGGTTTAPGMPSTGNGDFSLALIVALLALTLTGAGLKLARRKA